MALKFTAVTTADIALIVGYSLILRPLFAKLQTATISFVMSVSPSTRMERLGSHWTDFREI
jgi:hypothetical protein